MTNIDHSTASTIRSILSSKLFKFYLYLCMTNIDYSTASTIRSILSSKLFKFHMYLWLIQTKVLHLPSGICCQVSCSNKSLIFCPFNATEGEHLHLDVFRIICLIFICVLNFCLDRWISICQPGVMWFGKHLQLHNIYKGPVKLMQRVKIAHSFLQFVSNQFHVTILSLPM